MRRHRLQAVTLGHVRANQVVWHSSCHDDGSGFQLVDGQITRAEQQQLERFEAGECIHRSDPAFGTGYQVVIDTEGLSLLASLPQQRRAA
jgi:hypothetical protein